MTSNNRWSFLVLALLMHANQVLAFNVADYNPVWTAQSTGVSGSMPIGNGETTCNVWVQDDAIHMLIARTDAWNENGKHNDWIIEMLPKLAKVDIKFTPSIFNANFSQVLRLDQGTIEISGGTGAEAKTVRIWVDANSSVIRIQSSGAQKAAMSISLDKGWGTGVSRTYETTDSMLAFYHRNAAISADWDDLTRIQGVNKANYTNPLANRTFGGLVSMAKGVISGSAITSPADSSVLAEIFTHTSSPATIAGWITEAKSVITKAHAIPVSKAYTDHVAWWKQFWGRSWITLDNSRKEITTNYLQQRFINACQGRGNYPIKFNGSNFNFNDYRSWGGAYWIQNTRLIYWPLLATGDFDLMQPFFKMYTDMLPIRLEQSKAHYGHEGMHIPETAHFFGLWDFADYTSPTQISDWVGFHYNGTLEIMAMMLDYYKYTGDTEFAKNKLIPFAKEALRFYDLHFKHVNGKLEIIAHALETYRKVKNPSCDVAGLQWDLDRLLELPPTLVPDSIRTNWTRLRTEIPALPKITDSKGNRLNYYEGATASSPSSNSENPELYAIFPYRLYGVDKADLSAGITSYNAKRFGCGNDWCQSAIQAAYLGLTDEAWSKTYDFLKNGELPFTAFWKGIDGLPQQNSGLVGMMGLQTMLLQAEGDTIRLFPAWNKSWNADFRLNAPGNTLIEGTLVNGVLTRLAVGPVSRKGAIKLMNGVTFNMDNVIAIEGGTASINPSKRIEFSSQQSSRLLKFSGESLKLPSAFIGKECEISVYSLEGKALGKFYSHHQSVIKISNPGLLNTIRIAKVRLK